MKTLKWILITLSLAATVTFVACEDEEENNNPLPAITLDCDFAHTDTTLTNDPNRAVDYIITCKAKVKETLTIEPGVVIHFETDAGIEVQNGGTLIAVGNAAEPIVLESPTDIKGSWAGLLVRSNDVQNTLEYVEIRNAGGDAFNSNGDLGTIINWADSHLNIDNCLIEKSASYGVNVSYGDVDITITNSTFTENDEVPVRMEAPSISGIDNTNDFVGNAEDFVQIVRTTINDGDHTWQKLNVPYLLTGGEQTINGGATLTIQAGTEIQFGADCGLAVDNDGSYIVADGSMSEPILFTGESKAPGAWKGLFFDSNNVNNLLNYCTIEYTGSGAFNSNGDIGAIIVWADTKLTLSNSTLRDSSAPCGINAPYNGEVVTETNNTYDGFTDNYCDS